MTRYKVTLQTVMQYLSKGGAVIYINAANEMEADEKVSKIIKVIESDMDELSAYRIYSYSIELSN